MYVTGGMTSQFGHAKDCASGVIQSNDLLWFMFSNLNLITLKHIKKPKLCVLFVKHPAVI